MFFKKELFSTYDQKQFQDIAALLEQNGIKYYTALNRPTNPDRYRGVPNTDSKMMTEYRLLVSRKNLEQAKSILEGV